MPELPPAVVERRNRAARSGVRTSLLSVPSAAGIEAVGLEPVGEVMGCAVRSAPRRHPMPYSGRRWEVMRQHGKYYDAYSRPYLDGMRTGYNSVLARIRREAKTLGADGIVGVQLTRTALDGGNEFVAMGTAVRARSKVRPTSLFTTELAGSDVAKLMLAGWAPMRLQWAAAAHAIDTHYNTLIIGTRNSLRASNFELDAHTKLINDVRADARQEFDRMTEAAHADGGIVSDLTLSTWEPGEGVTAAIAVVCGTAVARFRRTDSAPADTLTVMPLWRRGEC